MLALSQGKNWLAQNKEIASEYDKVKEYQFMLFVNYYKKKIYVNEFE